MKFDAPNDNIMFVNINVMQFTLATVLLGNVVGNTNNLVYKRRMCIQYEMNDHTSTTTVIGRQVYCSKVECMTSCARNISCNTFHFRSTNCTCELLDTSDMCMSPKVIEGTTLVRLSGCNETPPWKVVTPTQKKLQWMEPNNVGSQRFILSTPTGIRQIGRALYEGSYVPGFALATKHRFFATTIKVGNLDVMIRCDEAFQVLTYAQPDDYLWINFTSGDEVPSSAVVGGYWRDEIPLYIVIGRYTLLWRPGFYSAATERVYARGEVTQPLTISLLLEN